MPFYTSNYSLFAGGIAEESITPRCQKIVRPVDSTNLVDVLLCWAFDYCSHITYLF
jgi:hypothetical protein